MSIKVIMVCGESGRGPNESILEMRGRSSRVPVVSTRGGCTLQSALDAGGKQPQAAGNYCTLVSGFHTTQSIWRTDLVRSES